MQAGGYGFDPRYLHQRNPDASSGCERRVKIKHQLFDNCIEGIVKQASSEPFTTRGSRKRAALFADILVKLIRAHGGCLGVRKR